MAIGSTPPKKPLEFAATAELNRQSCDTGANRRSDDMAQLRLSRMLRVGSNNMTRRFRSSLDNAR
jgi:hypothetical protein